MADQQPMFADPAPDLRQQIAELEREIKERRRVYPRLMAKGTLSPETSDYRIRCLQETIKVLTAQLPESGTF